MKRTCRKNYSLAEENLITRAETLRVESIAVEVDGNCFCNQMKVPEAVFRS